MSHQILCVFGLAGTRLSANHHRLIRACPQKLPVRLLRHVVDVWHPFLVLGLAGVVANHVIPVTFELLVRVHGDQNGRNTGVNKIRRVPTPQVVNDMGLLQVYQRRQVLRGGCVWGGALPVAQVSGQHKLHIAEREVFGRGGGRILTGTPSSSLGFGTKPCFPSPSSCPLISPDHHTGMGEAAETPQGAPQDTVWQRRPPRCAAAHSTRQCRKIISRTRGPRAVGSGSCACLDVASRPRVGRSCRMTRPPRGFV